MRKTNQGFKLNYANNWEDELEIEKLMEAINIIEEFYDFNTNSLVKNYIIQRGYKNDSHGNITGIIGKSLDVSPIPNRGNFALTIFDCGEIIFQQKFQKQIPSKFELIDIVRTQIKDILG